MKRERPPIIRDVQLERDGQVHIAKYTINGPLLTVSSVTLGAKSARIGATAPDVLAKMLLRELVDAEFRRR